MPQMTVYVRNEDVERWNAIESKSAWLHDKLNEDFPSVEQAKSRKEQPAITTGKSMSVCKNGHPIPEGRDKCLGKGCKYAS